MKTTKYYPKELLNENIWFLWRIETQNGRKTKVPYSARYNGKAKSNEPSTWCRFNLAMTKLKESNKYFGGVGIAIPEDDDLIFIDIDHCIENGKFNPISEDIMKRFPDSFIEISQSGSGVHIITRGHIPRNFKNSKNNVEMYGNKRFVSMTGNAIQCGNVSNCQSAVDYVFEAYKTPEPEKTLLKPKYEALEREDKWILERATRQRKFSDLYQGNWKAQGFESQSEADLSFCISLAFWTNCNVGQMDRLFKSSGLYRSKWERKDYRETTLISACNKCRFTLVDYIKENTSKEVKELEEAYSEQWDIC